MLGIKSSNEEREEAERKERRELHQQLLERLALDKELEVLRERMSVDEEFRAEHQNDLAAYKLRAEKWGPYLSLFIERLTSHGRYRDESGGYKYTCEPVVRFWAGALYLPESSTIEFVEGHPVDMQGSVVYRSAGGSDGGAAVAPREGYKSLPERRTIHTVQKKISNNRHCGAYYEPQQPKHITPNWPRPAADDKIIFNGIRTTLYIPYGRGQEVYGTILGALRG